VIKEIKILCAQTNKQKTNKKKIFRFWMDGGRVKKAESALLNFFVCVACRSSSLVRLFRVLPFSITLLKLHLFHSSLSLSRSLNSLLSFYFSFFRTLFLSLSLLFSPPLFVAGLDPPRTSSETKRARKTLPLSLSVFGQK